MTEKRGSFFRREKDSIRNILSQPLRSPDFSPLTYENAPGAARTRNLQLRRLTLYPVELRALVRNDYICRTPNHNTASNYAAIPSDSRGIPPSYLKGFASGSLGPSRTGGFARDDRRLLPHRGRFLAFAGAQVVELGPAGAAFFFHFHFGNARRMERKYALDSFAIGNTADGEGFVQTATFSTNDDTSKNLNAFLVAFHHSGMDADGVAHSKCRQFRFELVFLDGVNDAVHGSCFRGRSISADARQTQVPSSRAAL